MSDLNKLRGDLQNIFGESFGAYVEPEKVLQEDIDQYVLDEARPIPKFNFDKEMGDTGADPEADDDATPSIYKRGQDLRAKDREKDAYRKKTNKEIEQDYEKSGHAKDAALHGLEKDSDEVRAKDKEFNRWNPYNRHRKMSKKKTIPANTLAGYMKGNQHHYPFKNHSNLGPGPGTPPKAHLTAKARGAHTHKETGCWHCTCQGGGGIDCECRGTGKHEDCPKGHIKHIHIKQSYHDAYNDEYHDWEKEHGKIHHRKPKPHDTDKSDSQTGKGQEHDAGSKWSHGHEKFGGKDYAPQHDAKSLVSLFKSRGKDPV